MNDEDFEQMLAEMQHERETRMRDLEVRPGDTTRSSGGVELLIEISPTTATVIDCNPGELRAWAEKMLAFADELDGRKPYEFTGRQWDGSPDTDRIRNYGSASSRAPYRRRRAGEWEPNPGADPAWRGE